MKEEKTYTASSTHTNSATTSQSLDLKEMEGKMREIEDRFLRSFSSIPYTVDYSGLMCAPNSYVMLVGTELDKKIRGLK